ncbi:hypothetical protein D3C84_478610 [compost metagenome]
MLCRSHHPSSERGPPKPLSQRERGPFVPQINGYSADAILSTSEMSEEGLHLNAVASLKITVMVGWLMPRSIRLT